MAYSYPVTTQAKQGYETDGDMRHAQDVTMYLSTPGVGGKPRRVCAQSTTKVVINMTIWITTFLCCCEGDADDD